MKLSDQFLKDYRQMTAQGVKFTPEDIVLLNALSFKTRRSTTAARDVHLPRLAFLPRDSRWRSPIVLREPTIAHDLWIEMAARWIDLTRTDNFLFVCGFALSRRADDLPDAEDPRRLIRAVFNFAGRRLARFTRAQLTAAVDYALYGADWTVGAHAPGPAERGPQDPAGETPSPTLGLLADCRMLRLPISLDDARRMTASELTEAINRCWAEVERKFDPKRARTRAFGEYVRAREAIRARSLTAGAKPASRPGEEPR